jgi:PHD/YefM family antitoxin component YafN of YafNO toxin-antitoxin module
MLTVEAEMKTVSRRDFESDVAAAVDAARDAPVAIGEAGRIDFVILSAVEFARLKSRDRKVYSLDEIPDDLLERLAHIADEPYEVQ